MNEQEKINVFKNIDTSQLKKVAESEKPQDEQYSNINVDADFNRTNQHTKHTLNFEDNTDNNENNGNNANTENTETSKGGKNRLGKILPGKIALSMADKMIPSLLVLALYYMNLQLDKKKLQLTKEEINELAPAVQDCLDSIEINFDNPFVTLGVMLGVVYGGKIIDAIPEIKKADRKAKPKTFAEKLNAIVEDVEEIKDNPRALFEQDYQQLAEEVKAKRNRGIKDAQSYLAEMFPEKIKALGKKYNVDVTDQLNFRHVQPSQINQKKKKKKADEFNLE